MKKTLENLQDRLSKALERAETLAGSENEDTASKYEEVADSVQEAIDALSTAIDLLS